MIGLLTWLMGSKTGQYIAIGAVAVAAIALVLYESFAAGKASEKVKAQRRTIENVQKRMTVDDEVRRLSPDERRARLLQWSRDS